MAVSLWLLFDQQLYMQSVGAEQTDYYVGTYIILGIGGVMTLVGATDSSSTIKLFMQKTYFVNNFAESFVFGALK